MSIALPGFPPLVQLFLQVLAVLERLLTAVGPVLPAFVFSRQHLDFLWEIFGGLQLRFFVSCDAH